MTEAIKDPRLLVVDIETAMVQDAAARAAICNRVRKTVHASHEKKRKAIKAKYKLKETVEKHLAELGSRAGQEIVLTNDAIHSTPLNGGLGEVFCCGFALGEQPPQCYYRKDIGGIMAHPPAAGCSGYDGEKELLTAFMGFVREEPLVGFAGHNVEFDLRFLFQRCAVRGVPVPVSLASAIKYRSSKNVFDTMTIWSGWQGKRVSLDELAEYLGIPGKTEEVSGAVVPHLIENNHGAKVVEYNLNDVEVSRQVAWRLGV